MNNPRPKLWSKDFIVFSTATFFMFLPFYLLMTTMAVYAIEEFSASNSLAGLASSIFVFGELGFRMFTGKFIEIIGRKKLLYGGLVLFFLSTLLYFTVNSLPWLLGVRFIHGAAFGIASTAISAAVMDIIPPQRRGEGTNYYTLSTTLATAIGPMAGIILSQQANSNVLFLACTVFAVTAIIVTLAARIPKAVITQEQLEAMKGFSFKEFFEVNAIPIAVMTAIMAFCYSGILTFLTAYSRETGLIEAASYFFIIYSLFIFIGRPISGRLFDKKGENIVIYPALMLFIAGLVILSQAREGYMILTAAALTGLGHGTMVSNCHAIAIKESPRHRVGLATSTFFIGADGGMGFGPFLLGFLVPVLGYRGLYLTIAGLVLASIMVYFYLHGRKASLRKKQKVYITE